MGGISRRLLRKGWLRYFVIICSRKSSARGSRLSPSQKSACLRTAGFMLVLTRLVSKCTTGGPPFPVLSVLRISKGAPSLAEKRGVGFCASQQKVGLRDCLHYHR